MAKKVVKELAAAERAVLSRKINECALEQVQADHHGGRAATLKKEIRAMLEGAGLVLHETGDSFARIDEKEGRGFDEDAILRIQKIVDPADFESICPRKVSLSAFDEVVGHHRYPELEKLPKLTKSRSLTIGQLAKSG